MLLKDKIAIVYGAGGSIGGAVARNFAGEGARLYLAGRRKAPLEKVAKDARAAGASVEIAEVDAWDEADVEAHVAAVEQQAGAIDVLFNAIGMEDTQGCDLIDMRFDDFFRPISKAAATQFNTARAVARRMVARGAGVIMTITAGPPDATAKIGGFGPACHMIEGMWRGFAAELSPRGVRVICLRSAGSPDSTDFQEMVRQHTEISGGTGQDFIDQLGSGQLQRRLPMLAEVANVAAMMASDRASALTGTFVHVTCGDRGG